MANTVNTIFELVDDHLSAVTGNTSPDRKIRQISRALDYFQRKLGLPSNERVHSFLFSEDQHLYPAPVGFLEQIQMLYHDPEQNRPETEWEHRDDSELLLRTGTRREREWGITTRNGQFQLVLKGRNLMGGILIDDLNSVEGWEAEGDAENVERDALEKKVGDASLRFDITKSTNIATIKKTVSLNLQTQFEKHAIVKLWQRFTAVGVEDVTLRFYKDASNYWSITATELDDGSDFSTNEWQKVGFPFDDAVKTGDIEIGDTITQIELSLSLGGDFPSSATAFRFDHMRTVVPDRMAFTYYTHFQGTDASGATEKVRLTNLDDLVYILNFFPDMDDLVARKAALALWPSLRADKEWFGFYHQELRAFEKDHAMRWPRKRTHRYLRSRLKANI